MDATLKALVDLLIEAVPTIVFFLFLAWYLKRTYFQPVGAILAERKKATEGVRELAQRAFEAADKRKSEFDRAIQLARGEIWDEQEKLRREWSDEQAAQIAEARAQAEGQIEDAKKAIAAEADGAQAALDRDVEGLSQKIVDAVLERRAA
ncbi:MAG TPA: ATP synthase F0 subunit B [Bryobacteraceae bacterium]|jgi:F0F1-type ATP synthase membrane subunit b/b'|nr:ATP synthase F0 subunit B [Bryobacteraceae bacterium]